MKIFKSGKFICTFGLMMLLGIGSITLQAKTSYPFSLSFPDTNTTVYTNEYEKATTDQFWCLSLHETNEYTGTVNTLSSDNIFGCTMHRRYGDKVDVYHPFFSIVTRYRIGYQIAVNKGDKMFIVSKKDSRSTDTNTLKVSGRFIP